MAFLSLVAVWAVVTALGIVLHVALVSLGVSELFSLAVVCPLTFIASYVAGGHVLNRRAI